MKIFNF
jgi:hypothetical protein